MSTRSHITVIRHTCGSTIVTRFYRHHDGYPQGMASFLIKAGAEKEKYRIAEQIAKTGEVEFAAEEHFYGDIEYAYVITIEKDEVVIGMKTRLFSSDGGRWDYKEMSLERFLDEHGGRKCPHCESRPTIKCDLGENNRIEVIAECECGKTGSVARNVEAAVALYNNEVIRQMQEG